jgi:hypothetical protein
MQSCAEATRFTSSQGAAADRGSVAFFLAGRLQGSVGEQARLAIEVKIIV